MTDGEVCLINIGPRERRRRLVFGLVMYACAAGALAAQLVMGSARPFRVLVVPLLVLGGYGVFQARAKTWVRLASRGLRNLDDGAKRIEDEPERVALRLQARRVIAQTFAVAAVLSAAALLIWPWHTGGTWHLGSGARGSAKCSEPWQATPGWV